MKRIISLILSLILCAGLMAASGAEEASPIGMVMVPIDAQDMRLGQCMVPVGYNLTVAPDFMSVGRTRGVTDPLGLCVVASSPDGRSVMSYEKSNTYVEIVSSTVGGRPNRVHEDGKFDSSTMTPMVRYLQPSAYALNYLNGMYPGVAMTYVGSMDLSEYQPIIQRQAEAYYLGLKAGYPEWLGMNIDGVAIPADMCEFTCEMTGETYNIVVGTIIEATQMTLSMVQLQGMLEETEVLWSPLCTYVLAAPATEVDPLLPAFEAFKKNTSVSDQFIAANQKLANDLKNIIVGRWDGYSLDVLRDATADGDTYDEERFTDYIFDQNDYTLSDGTHVKIPTEYEYVYEGDNNVVYFTKSTFPEPGVQLDPNR